MRKFVLSAVALCVSFGLTLAADVVFVKFDKDKKEVTVKDGDKESTYKITDDLKFKRGEKDGTAEDAVKYFTGKRVEAGKTKFEVTVEKDKLTEVKVPAAKGKGKN